MKKKIDMVWEWNWPKICWNWGTFVVFELEITVEHKGDHSPGFHALFMVLGIKLIDCGYYNSYHEDDLEDE